ncbi:MAG: phosphoribosylformylglycinamidine synthase subunit PurS [Pseudomonadota bacterium]
MKAKIEIRLKAGVLDPQGKAIESALAGLGYENADGVRQGKIIELNVDAADETAAKAQVEEMCRKILANPVMETYSISIENQ